MVVAIETESFFGVTLAEQEGITKASLEIASSRCAMRPEHKTEASEDAPTTHALGTTAAFPTISAVVVAAAEIDCLSDILPRLMAVATPSADTRPTGGA